MTWVELMNSLIYVLNCGPELKSINFENDAAEPDMAAAEDDAVLVSFYSRSFLFFCLNSEAEGQFTNVLVVDFLSKKDSFGLVNGIEVVPVGDDKLFTDSVERVGGNGANASLGLGKWGIETFYRLNVGGSTIRPDQDSELWRL